MTKNVRHKVLVGINYRPTAKSDEVRAEPGDIVDDIPPALAKLWVADGVLEQAADQ